MYIASYSNHFCLSLSHSLFHATQHSHTHNCKMWEAKGDSFGFFFAAFTADTKLRCLRLTFTFFSFAINTIQEKPILL